jgi:FSR family fosmidomycin resistance protein-like MFS transporter
MTIRKDAEVIGLVSLAHGSSHFFHLILAPLFPWLKTEFGLSYAELGFLMTVFFIVSTIMQAAAGFWVDHSGPLKVLFFGVATLAISALILATSNGYIGLLTGACIAGLGNGVFHPADYTLLNRRVSPERVPHAYSMHGVSGALGWAASPAVLVMVTTATNWRQALLVAAAMAAAVLTLLYARRHVLQGSAEERLHEAQAKKNTSPFSISFLKLPTVWLCWGFFLLSALALSGVQSFAPTAMQLLYDLPLALTTTAYSTYMLASAGGMVVGGFVATRSKFPDRIIAISFITASLICIVISLVIVSGSTMLTLFTVMGFCVGIAGPSRDLMIRAATPKESSGRVFGVLYSGLDSGLAIGPLLFGLLMDWDLAPAVFILIATFLLLALLTAYRVGENNRLVHLKNTSLDA